MSPLRRAADPRGWPLRGLGGALSLALAPALVLVVLLGAWEAYVDLGAVNDLVLPAPHQIAAALYDDGGVLWRAFVVSAEEIVGGSLLAAAAGLAMAFAMHFSAAVRRALYPLLVASQAVPVPLLAPLLIFWLGFGSLPKLIVVALVSFFSIVITTMAALATVDPAMGKLMRTFDASRLAIFRHVELPAALPGLFTGLKLTLVVAVIADVLAEQGAGSSNGLGYILMTAGAQLLPAEAYAAAGILSALAIAVFVALTVAERRLLPWAYQPKGS